MYLTRWRYHSTPLHSKDGHQACERYHSKESHQACERYHAQDHRPRLSFGARLDFFDPGITKRERGKVRGVVFLLLRPRRRIRLALRHLVV